MSSLTLLKISVTSAAPAADKESDPEKITSPIEPARKRAGLPSPRANNTASVTLLFPEPFGPTITVTPAPSGILTGRANVLKPFIYIAESTNEAFYVVLTMKHKRKRSKTATQSR